MPSARSSPAARRGSVSRSRGCSATRATSLTLAGAEARAARGGAAGARRERSIPADVSARGGLRAARRRAHVRGARRPRRPRQLGRRRHRRDDRRHVHEGVGPPAVRQPPRRVPRHARRAPRASRATRGYVVNLASIAGHDPDARARDLRRREGGADRADAVARPRGGGCTGVRATALCPGFVDTPMAAWTGHSPAPR